ncbi:hypothetical protein C7974DRAFT_77040 [Boeremia exigua]|uniref:uncharacterized protein n=1 Tax=Boeremia exigua TaxID=749465 RepID=UPI001E8D3D78|nr:uncharacterized protein C7974DRAFT_77040 [Boeremia exigua]KAH6613203.1 hypothetical protein C7974DRAFT_77040 [Boeremia exigua]
MSFIETIIVPDDEGNLSAEHGRSVVNSTQCLDGREKKRIQNRIAQRTNRRHMKMKLEVLQEKIKTHEKNIKEPAKVQSSSSTSVSPTASTTVDSICPVPAVRDDHATIFEFLMTPLPDVGDGCPSHEIEAVNQATFVNPDSSTAAFSLDIPPWTWNTTPGLQEPPAPMSLCSTSGAPARLELDAFCSPQSLHGPRPNKEAHLCLSDYLTDMPQEEVQRNVDTTVPLQERLRYIKDQAVAMGFRTFDEVIAAYYTELFEPTSPLYKEQRLSRNRRLPQLLNTFHNAAKDWAEWERRGFREQITQGAEEILVEELNSYIARHSFSAAGERLASYGLECKHAGRRDRQERREVQDDLPNLWALAIALLSRDNTLDQNARRDTVLTVIETLCFDQSENLEGRLQREGEAVVHINSTGSSCS